VELFVQNPGKIDAKLFDVSATAMVPEIGRTLAAQRLKVPQPKFRALAKSRSDCRMRPLPTPESAVIVYSIMVTISH